jgi:hypothetical protein
MKRKKRRNRVIDKVLKTSQNLVSLLMTDQQRGESRSSLKINSR